MKKWMALLLALVMMFMLVACGEKAENTPAPTNGAETQGNADVSAQPEETQPQGGDITIEGATFHTAVNVGDYMTISYGENSLDKLKTLNYDGLTVEYDITFGDDGVVTFALCENQDAFWTGMRDKVEEALKDYYKGVMEQKGVTVSVEKYMEMEKVDVDYYVEHGSRVSLDLSADSCFAKNMFPETANYVVDAESNAIYWSKLYSDARIFEAGVKWDYTVSGGNLQITGQNNKSGYVIDQWAGVAENSAITPDQATIFPMVLVQK